MKWPMWEKGMKRKNPWERENLWERGPDLNPDYYITAKRNAYLYTAPDVMHYITMLSHKRPKFQAKDKNVYLDVDTKRAALKASPSVVALVSYTGEQELIQGSGIIIECDDNNSGIVLTSANLIRCGTKGDVEQDMMENNLADNLKVVVHLFDGTSYEGKVSAYDFHYNIASIRFQSDSPLTSAILRKVDDYINVTPTQLVVPGEKSFQLCPHSSLFNLVPGNRVFAVGRYFAKPFDLMAAPGEFSLDRCDYDCKELFMGTCIITRCGEGGPLINLSGEVIGITFYDMGFTPFMPINIAQKWWEHYKRYGECRWPSLGIEATNFYAADLHVVEKVIQKYPSICNGVLVEKVIPGSSADSAGLRLDDVIVQCGGKTVESFMELFEIIWDKVGDLLEVVVVRADRPTPLQLNMLVVEAAADKLNCWPRLSAESF